MTCIVKRIFCLLWAFSDFPKRAGNKRHSLQRSAADRQEGCREGPVYLCLFNSDYSVHFDGSVNRVADDLFLKCSTICEQCYDEFQPGISRLDAPDFHFVQHPVRWTVLQNGIQVRETFYIFYCCFHVGGLHR